MKPNSYEGFTMRVTLLLTIFLLPLLALPPEFSRHTYDQGEKIFENKCSSCHEKSMPIKLLMRNFIYEENQLLNLKAPTGNQISFRLKSQIGSQDDIEFQLEETVDFVVDYLYHPDKAKTACLPGVIRHFETMPSMKGKINENDIAKVTHFLYFLEGFNGVNEFYHKE